MYLEELSLLQDRITPFSTEVAFGMIEEELGLPIDMLFSEISPEPIAAASLGQVVHDLYGILNQCIQFEDDFFPQHLSA